MREYDRMVIDAQSNKEVLEALIKQCEFFILKTTSEIARRFISINDDEYSIALMAFVQAVDSYEIEKGSFFSFAELLIKRRLVDYFRTQAKYMNEMNVSPYVFTSDPEEEDMAIVNAVNNRIVCEEDHGATDIKGEIKSISGVIDSYGFSFMDLTDSSPKAAKTKAQCAEACAYVLRNPMLLTKMRETKQFPIKIVEDNCKISRKTLERHRKYLIAAIEILSGDFPYLAEYLRFMKEVQNDESGRS